MILSRKWLNEFVDGVSVAEVSDRAFSEAMTLSGSKVETVEDHAAQFKNVVVGKILSMEKHPNSDHMWVVQMDVGEAEPVQICTGAWNIHVGDLVPVARHNALLPGGVKITKGKLRGVLSNGMLCSLAELGVDTRDFPYATIQAAAILGDYHVLPGEKPSIPEDVQPGLRIYGKVYTAKVLSCETVAYSTYRLTVDWGKGEKEVSTRCANIHAGDMICVNTASGEVLTLAGLHAQQKEFPNCIEDGIFILDEECKPGDDIPAVLGLDDHVVEFEITPNRPDCLGVIGLAREAAVTFGHPLKLHEPEIQGAGGSILDYADVDILDGDLCPRYCGRLVKNVKIGPSPKWMRERLRASGVRPINNIVDITNYVMLEYGQPMHAFDYRYVNGGKIIVRRAAEGEELTTLDGNVRRLNHNHLVIADETRAVGLAGIMGGMNSEIVADTTDVVFESACFDGPCIRKGALALGMRTDASAKNEKGLDPMNTLPAVQRACELVELLGAGEVVDGVIDILNHVPEPTVLKLEPDKINALLGTCISEEEMTAILEKLDFRVEGGLVTVPSWRGDVKYMADLAEEVARFHGYNNIPSTLMKGQTTLGGRSPAQLLERRLGRLCRSAGYNEIITYSFTSPASYDKLRWPPEDPRRNSFQILNPLGEDTSIMRTTLLSSLLEILARNWNLRNPAARLYEIGRIYLPGGEQGLAVESRVLGLGAYGEEMDFFALKGAVETILEDLRVERPRFTPCGDNPSYHPGRCAQVWSGEDCLGVFGQIHPLCARSFGADGPLYCAELSFEALERARGPEPEYVPLPKFPAVDRDICVVCDETVAVGALEDCIRAARGGLLKHAALFDIYRGDGVPQGKKSVAFSLTLRSEERSLTAAEADETVAAVLAALEAELGAVLR
ncbi:MAG: phenylalanine--tRNA ligase subunit beta [Clostridiales bacterium]|nr:phenylalanine--tRNA ligase subunit beta [Clostridiales bacterium]